MCGEVVIGALELSIHGLPEVGSGEAFVHRLLEYLERELDRHEVDRTAELNLRRLELSLSLVTECLDPEGIAAQIARVLAGRIAEAASWARQGVPPVLPHQVTTTAVEAEVLVEAATLVAQGRTQESHRRLVQLGRVAPEEHLAGQPTPSLVEASAILAELGRWARADQVELRIGRLVPLEIRRWLEALQQSLETTDAPLSLVGPPSGRWDVAWTRVAARPAPWSVQDRPRSLLRVVCELVRLSPRWLEEDLALRARLGAALHDVLSEESPELRAESSASEPTWESQPPSSPGRVPSVHDEPTLANAVPSYAQTLPIPSREPRPEVTAASAEDPLCVASELGGLVFALVPLLASDFDERRHPDGVLMVYEVLRGVIESELGPEFLADPAIHYLSGLMDAPKAEDRHPEHPRLAAPWIRLVRDDLRAWLSWPVDRRLQPILQIPARIWLRPDRLVVQLPFTEHYTALLKAGLLVDWRFLRWLDHRDLRLSFGRSPWEES